MDPIRIMIVDDQPLIRERVAAMVASPYWLGKHTTTRNHRTVPQASSQRDPAAEALRNAFRHASASRIEMEITYNSSELPISVRDDGGGIDEGVSSNGHLGHWGLTRMRAKRARAIRAEFTIWSREAAGAEMELVTTSFNRLSQEARVSYQGRGRLAGIK